MEKTMRFLAMTDWEVGITSEPFVIAGPCSAETEQQVLATARQVASQGVKAFRAGIWKPRTRPNSFEGVGVKGLPWLTKVKEETGMLVATEVANQHHVYEALKHNVDILWIGARTTANPFAVQDIATALTGVDVIVLVKNPVNPEIDLWVGAIERIYQAGIRRMAAIHRGFSTFEKSNYRNAPLWQVPIELIRRLKGLPILIDPSHICGNRELRGISQKALDLNYSGMIIEVHIDPDHALSDAKQQITPVGLKDLLASLKNRNLNTTNEEFIHTLDILRRKIDKLDDEILEILHQRFTLVETIGNYKKKNNVTVLQPNRWQEILTKARQTALELNLNPDFVEKIFKTIHEESINSQTKIMNDDSNSAAFEN